MYDINPLNAELNPICHLLALLGAHPILHVGGIRVKINSFIVLKMTGKKDRYTAFSQVFVSVEEDTLNK